MIATTILFVVNKIYFLAGIRLDLLKTLKDRTVALHASSNVINLANAWVFNETLDGRRNVNTVDLVAHLFSFVSKDRITLAPNGDLDAVAQKPLEFDTAMVGCGPDRQPPRKQAVGILK